MSFTITWRTDDERPISQAWPRTLERSLGDYPTREDLDRLHAICVAERVRCYVYDRRRTRVANVGVNAWVLV